MRAAGRPQPATHHGRARLSYAPMTGFWEGLSALLPYAGALVEAFAFALIPLVLVRRREPPSTIAWILALIFLPGLGAALFLLHGRDRVRWPAKRKRAADQVVEARMRLARPDLAPGVAPELAAMRLSERRIFNVCQRLGQTTELSGGNRVELFTDGGSAVDAMEQAIDSAQKSVLFECYLIRNDATGTRFREKLSKAAARGVDVRVLLDAYGCFWLPSAWFKTLRRSGAKLAEFLPLRQALRLPMNLRTHRKILVVDGVTAFTGGVNIGDEYVRETGHGKMWRDTHMRVEGPAVASLTAIFLRDWHFMTGESEVRDEFFPEPVREGRVTMAIVPSGPDDTVEAIHRTFFAAIVGARTRVWITTPYFVPDRSLLVALETAAHRGVDVKLLLPSRSNHQVTHQAGASYYAELLECGVEIYEYLPGMIHAKTMLVDDEISLVGSANMDMRSFRLNFEVHALLHDPKLAQALEASFLEDRSESKKLDYKLWMSRPWGRRVGEGAARLISPIL
jgi:cardiolipin synthase A/B